ncbi:hypothetical protein [Paenibacillus amylolyticus]|uniref:hypothetical protein n=1 Tax=Paenibacillus amylolyticus TaxID=1451 RepID=UPI0033922F69
MQSPEKLLWIPFLAFFLFFTPDMITYGQWQWKANQLTDFAVERMAASGGWTATVEEEVSSKMKQMGFDKDKWIIYRTDGVVKAPGNVQFQISSKYHLRAFSILGEKMHKAMGDSTVLTVLANQQKSSQIY